MTHDHYWVGAIEIGRICVRIIRSHWTKYSPLVLLPDEVLLRQVDQVDHRLGRDEQVLVQNFDLKNETKNKFSFKKMKNDSFLTEIWKINKSLEGFFWTTPKVQDMGRNLDCQSLLETKREIKRCENCIL